MTICIFKMRFHHADKYRPTITCTLSHDNDDDEIKTIEHVRA